MAHISTIENPWGKCFTVKRYLHAPLTENIVTMWPSTMVMIGEISGEDDPHTHYSMHHNESKLPSAAVIFTLKRDSDLMFAEKYNCDAAYVSKLVAVSTILALVTMPLIVLLVQI